MAEVTLQNIAKVVQAELKLQLEPVNTKLEAIGETVSAHTGALFEISKDVKDLKQQMTDVNRRFGKNEEAIKYTAEKVGILPEVKRIIEA